MSIHQITGTIIGWLNHESKPSTLPLCDFERFRHELKPCDVILVEGRSRVSSVIRLITASPWTHAALYIGRIHDIEDPALRETLQQYCDLPPNEQLIIESVLGKGTIVNTLSFYANDHIRICRPTGLTYKDAQQVVRYAMSRLGAEYDVRQIFDLARFLFPWILLPRRWRSSLFRSSAGDSTRTVCSTMIAEAFGFIQFPILPLVKKISEGSIQLFRRNPKICVPSDFDYSPHFEIIKYPFIDLGLHKDHRLLPWKGSGQLSAEEAKLYFEDQDDTPDQPVASGPTPGPSPSTEQQSTSASNSDAPTPSEPTEEPVSKLKLVASKLEDALPRGWRESNNQTEKTTEKTTAEESETDITAEANIKLAAKGTDEQAQGQNASTERTETDTSKERPVTETAVTKGTNANSEEADDIDLPGSDDDGNTVAQEKPKQPDQTDVEASAVEKWLRSITSVRPKSED